MSQTIEALHTANTSRLALAFMAATFCVVAYAGVFGGGPIAQTHGDLRTMTLFAFAAEALIGTIFFAVTPRPFEPASKVYRLAFLLPAYALFQLIPVAIPVIRFLSPERADLNEALRPVVQPLSLVPISVTPAATLYHFVALSACAGLFLVIFNVSGAMRLSPWAVTVPLMVVAADQALLGLIQVSANPEGIATGTYVIRNHYAGLLEIVLPFSLTYPFVARSRSQAGKGRIIYSVLGLLSLLVAGLIAVAMVASLSRGGFFAALISVGFMATVALCRGQSVRRKALILVATTAATSLALVALPSARLVERFGDMRSAGEDRPPAWRDTIQLIKAYPVVGCGLGAYESAFVKFKRSAPALNQDYAHNDYLQYLAEMGVVGFALGAIPLALLVTRLLAALRNPDPQIRLLSLACAGSVVAMAIHSIVDFNLYVPANMLAFSWVLGLSAFVGEWSQRTAKVPGGSRVIVLE